MAGERERAAGAGSPRGAAAAGAGSARGVRGVTGDRPGTRDRRERGERPAIGRCPRCRRGVTVDYGTARDAGWQIRSGCCGRWTVVRGVDGAVSSRACGPHCEDATSPRCQCECGGVSHGLTWRTSIARLDPIATFELSEPPIARLTDPEVAPIAPLRGVDWGAVDRDGEVAMFDVSDPGELQHWEPRGGKLHQ